MIEGLVAGKVSGRPEQRTSNSTGKAFTVAKVRAATSSGETLFVNVLAFDATAQAALLARQLSPFDLQWRVGRVALLLRLVLMFSPFDLQ